MTKFQEKVIDYINEELPNATFLTEHGRKYVRLNKVGVHNFSDIIDQLLAYGLKHSTVLECVLQATKKAENV